MKGVGSQRKLPTINWYGLVLNRSFGREREGRTRRPHIKGVGSQSKLPTINCTGGYSMEVLVEREGGARRPHMKGVGS